MNLRLFILIMCFLSSNTIISQGGADCFLKHQITKMQTSSLEDISRFLNIEEWSFDGASKDQFFQYKEYELTYDLVSWTKSYYDTEKVLVYNAPNKQNVIKIILKKACFNKLLKSLGSSKRRTRFDEDKFVTVFKVDSKTIEFIEEKDRNSRDRYSILVYNTYSLSKEIRKIEDHLREERFREEAKRRAEEEKHLSFLRIIQEGDDLFAREEYVLAKEKYLSALNVKKTSDLEEQIAKSSRALVLKGDTLYYNSKYSEALRHYKLASESNSSSNISRKIQRAEQKLLAIKINNIKDEANKKYEDNNLDGALELYKEIISLDPTNEYAKNRINSIYETQKILRQRKYTVFSYKETNKEDFVDFKEKLYANIDYEIGQSREGFLNFKYQISFDTLGRNKSNFQSISTSISDYENSLVPVTLFNSLSPSERRSFYLESKSKMKFAANWTTSIEKVKANSDLSTNNNNLNSFVKPIRNYIYKQPIEYGRYVFEVKTKDIINGDSYTDINLVKFKTPGPSSVFYSMIMPGMGTLKVTGGEKGWGRFTWFVLSTGLAVSSKIYSNEQYNKYLNAANSSDSAVHYDNANLSNKVALVSGGISASIYVYDIFWVLSKGAQNKKRSKLLRKRLKKGPVQVQNQKILW